MVYHSVYGGGWGSFGKGFSESFAAMLKLIEDKRHNQALEDHWARMDANNPYAAANAAGAEGRAGFKEGDTGTYGGDGGGGGGAVTGKFWTPENQQHAYNVLMQSGKFSEYGAAGAVARMTREAPDGPTSVNPSSKAFGIAQWLGDRKTPIAGNTNFDDQLKYYAGADLDAPEQARAKEQFKNASNASEGSYAAMHFERAGGYKESGGRTDVLLNNTPTANVYATVHGKGGTEETGKVTETTAQAGDTGPNNVYAKIPVKDSEGRDQLPMFTRWNPDPIGNEKANIAQLNPDMQRVITRAHADNPNLNFVLGSGKRSAQDQDLAKSWGWSKVGSKDGGDAATHMQGKAADLWALDENGQVTFDPDAQAKVTAAMKAAAKKEGVNINAGGDWKHPDQPHFELKGKGSAQTAGNEGPPVLHDGSYQVAGDTDIALTPEAAERARKRLEAHRVVPDTRTPEQMDRESPAPPPGSAAPQPKRSLPLDQQGPPAPSPPRPGERVSAIPPGPTVAAQDRPFRTPVESGYPESAQTLPAEPPMTTQQGPESPYAPPDRSVYTGQTATLSPSDQPSSGVGVSVHDSRQGPPQRTGAPPNVGITPSAIPQGPEWRNMPPPGRPVMGPDQGPMATINPQTDTSPFVRPHQPPSTGRMPVDTSPAARNMPYVGETPSGNQRDPKGVYAPKPAPPSGRSPATTEADKPAPAAQPVSATQPTQGVAQPGSLPAGVIRYEVPNSSASRAPIYTAANFSSLWGPNPPVAQRGQAAASPPVAAAPSRNQDDYGDVASMPSQGDYNLGNQIMGSRKGGPIQRFANGGIPMRPTIKLQGGGNPGGGWSAQGQSAPPTQYTGAVPYSTWNSPTSTTYVPPASQPSMGVYAKTLAVPSPNPAYSGYQPWGGVLGGSGEMAKSNYASMTPDQQAWFNQQMANSQATGNQWYYNPASYPTTPAPAAPAPAAPAAAAPAPVVQPTTDATVTPVTDTTVIDPTTTSGAGAPGLPNNITAKSYDPNVDAKTGAGFANTNNAGGTNYTVDPKDTLKTNAAGDTISGFRQGGGIPSRPTMKYADAGTVSFTTQGYQGARTQGEQYYFSPDYTGPGIGSSGWRGAAQSTLAPNQQAWATNQQNLINQINTAAAQMGPHGGPDTSQYFNQFTVMPTAVWPTAAAPAAAVAPAAPVAPTTTATTPTVANTTKVDPTTTPGAGAPGLPDSLAPTPTPAPAPTPAPVVDPTINTVANTPDNPVPKQAKTYDPTQDTTGKYAKGPKDVGGSNYERSIDPTSASDFGANDYGQIQGFDDGGGVNPSALGMPPGLSGGGQQPPPPIYYNGATYTPAGAPVGKGVTQSSVPTYIAGAIPSLPMAHGGVVRYAEGGSVDEYSGEDTSARADDDVAQGGRSEQQGWSGQDTGGAAAPAPDAYASANSPQDVHPDLPAWTPQVNDGQGNPSRGLIGAISGGLHYIASQLGLDGSGQPQAIAGDPSIQANRRAFVQGDGLPGAPVPTHEEVAQLHQAIGTSAGLHEGLANLAGMEATRNFWLVHGDPQKADMMAASMLQYSVGLSRDYGDQAVQKYYANDLDGATHALNKAKEAIADGTMMDAKVNYDANGNPVSVNVEGRDLNGKALWAQTVGPQAILGAALHARDGSLAWHLYELQAAKYDPATANIIKMRQERAQQAAVDEQIGKLGPVSTPYTGGAPDSQGPQTIPIGAPTPAPRPPMPAGGPLAPGQPAIPGPPQVAALTPPVTAGGLGIDASRGQVSPGQQAILDANRGRSADTTTAQPAAPPRTADNNQVATGDLPAPPAPAGTEQDQQQQVAPAIPASAAEAARALNPPAAPTPGVLPPIPTREAAASAPSPDAQEVAELGPVAEQARYRQIEQTVRAKYTDPQTHGIVLDGQLYQIPQVPDQATYSKMAPQLQNYWKDRMATYRWAASEADKRAAQEIDADRRDYGVSLASQRADVTMRRQQGFLDQREAAAQAAATLAEQRRQADALQLERYKATLNEHNKNYDIQMRQTTPLSPDDAEKRVISSGGVYAPLAQAFVPGFKPSGKKDSDPEAEAQAALGNATLGSVPIDAGMQRVLGAAYKSGLQYSPLSTPEEIADGVMQLAKGVNTGDIPLDKLNNAYHIVVPRDDGSIARLSLPKEVALSLRTLGVRVAKATYEDATKKAIQGAPPVQSSPSYVTPQDMRDQPAPPQAIPGKPDFWSGGRQSQQPGPALKLPERVPAEQVPPEWQEQFPELRPQ